jgi:hypothetical protein
MPKAIKWKQRYFQRKKIRGKWYRFYDACIGIEEARAASRRLQRQGLSVRVLKVDHKRYPNVWDNYEIWFTGEPRNAEKFY